MSLSPELPPREWRARFDEIVLAALREHPDGIGHRALVEFVAPLVHDPAGPLSREQRESEASTPLGSALQRLRHRGRAHHDRSKRCWFPV